MTKDRTREYDVGKIHFKIMDVPEPEQDWASRLGEDWEYYGGAYGVATWVDDAGVRHQEAVYEYQWVGESRSALFGVARYILPERGPCYLTLTLKGHPMHEAFEPFYAAYLYTPGSLAWKTNGEYEIKPEALMDYAEPATEEDFDAAVEKFREDLEKRVWESYNADRANDESRSS